MNTESHHTKRRKAVALQYAEGEKAPHVVASGIGYIADRIVALAGEHNVPIEENTSLAEILSQIDVGYEIPPEAYRAVAEILAFLYRTDETWKNKHKVGERIAMLLGENSEGCV